MLTSLDTLVLCLFCLSLVTAVTPFDVIKSRMATGTCPIDVPACVQHVVHEGGVMGLYMGAGSRIIWSTAFAAIGFGMLETAKGWLGVADAAPAAPSSPSQTTEREDAKLFSRPQRMLDHAVSDTYK